MANGLAWGPDGWIYGAQGSTVTANIRGIEFQQGIWRYHPLSKEFELFAEGGGNTWGLDFDEDGNVLEDLVQQGKLGKKSGEGLFVWEQGKPKREAVNYDPAELERLGQELVKPLLDEAERALNEGVVENADHVDAGVIFGTGFAPFRGGPLHYRRLQEQAGRSAVAA